MRVAVAVLVALLLVGAVGLWISLSLPSPSDSVSTVGQVSPAATNPSPEPTPSRTPAARGALPNPHLTPGVASADVTPANIGSTICVVGYTSGRRHDDGRTVRPSSSYTTALKRQQIVQYGYRDFNLGDYEEDHLIPLELGGDGYAAGNLWPEPYAGSAGARVKDKVENALHRLVCDGQLGLRAAQQAIAQNWYAAYLHYAS